MPAAYPDADAIAATVLGCRDVVRLSGGDFGEIATYLPGRRVVGVSLRPEGLSVHVVVRYGPPLPEIAARIHRMLGLLVGGIPVEVVIDDLEMSPA